MGATGGRGGNGRGGGPEGGGAAGPPPNNQAAHQTTACRTAPEFALWEQPLTFSKTYYVDNTSPAADDNGPGSKARPFRTINKAAQVLQPGERVVIAAGTYRECVRPARGGTGPAQMISYEAAPGAKVYIKGSEVLKDGWRQEPISAVFGPGARRNQPPFHGATNSPARCFPMPTSPSPCPASWAAGRGSIHAWLTWGRICAGADWCSSTASRWSRWNNSANWRRRVFSRPPTSPFPPSRKTACRPGVGADRSCRRSAARPMRASGWRRRDRPFRSVWLRERRPITKSK